MIVYFETDIQTLYNLIGQSVWHLQHLENVLSMVTAMKILQKERDRGSKVTEDICLRALEKQRGFTLGPLISAAKREQTIPSILLERFDHLLQERNWLIHKCVINEFLSLRSATRKQVLFDRISSFVDETIALKNEINEILEKWYESVGYDLDYANQIAKETVREAEQR